MPAPRIVILKLRAVRCEKGYTTMHRGGKGGNARRENLMFSYFCVSYNTPEKLYHLLLSVCCSVVVRKAFYHTISRIRTRRLQVQGSLCFITLTSHQHTASLRYSSVFEAQGQNYLEPTENTTMADHNLCTKSYLKFDLKFYDVRLMLWTFGAYLVETAAATC